MYNHVVTNRMKEAQQKVHGRKYNIMINATTFENI